VLLYYFILSNDLGVGTVGSFQRTVDPAAPAADDADSRFGLLFPLYNTYQLYKLEDETHPRASSMCDSEAGGCPALLRAYVRAFVRIILIIVYRLTTPI